MQYTWSILDIIIKSGLNMFYPLFSSYLDRFNPLSLVFKTFSVYQSLPCIEHLYLNMEEYPPERY